MGGLRLPEAPSIGEATLEFHLKAHGIRYEAQYRPVDCRRRWVWDFAIPAFRLLIEVNGSIWRKGGHNTGKGLERDYEKSRWAVLNGWKPLSYSTGQVERGDAIADVLVAIGSTEP
jgi:very-short-patch-repair endonuclease